MNDIVKLLLKIFNVAEYLMNEYRKKEREAAIKKIKDNPNKAWDARFGNKEDSNEE